MLTFFEAWPAFHICAGHGALFALTIIGDPQLLCCTLKELLQMPAGAVCSAEERTRGSGEVSLEWTSARLRARLGTSEASSATATCTYVTVPCVYSKHTVVESKLRHLSDKVPMLSQTYHTQQEPLFLKRISSVHST